MSHVSNEALITLNRKLRDENELLKAQIAYLTGAMASHDALPREWKLTTGEERIIRILVSREFASMEGIITALYWDKEEPIDPEGTIRVMVSKMRKKLRPHGIEIKTHWGRGFYLPAEVRRRFRSQANQRAAA
jgi:DNA-binding response OmpR family regulator